MERNCELRAFTLMMLVCGLISGAAPITGNSTTPSTILTAPGQGLVAPARPDEWLRSTMQTGGGNGLQPDAQSSSCLQPSNPIVSENCKPGTDDWAVDKELKDIVGFA